MSDEMMPGTAEPTPAPASGPVGADGHDTAPSAFAPVETTPTPAGVSEPAPYAAAGAPSSEHVTAEPSTPSGATADLSAAAPAPEPSAPASGTSDGTAPAPTDAADGAAASVTGDAAAQPTERAEPDRGMQQSDIDKQYDRSLRQLEVGDLITGTVMRVDREGVLVDVGAKSEGIIRPGELSRDPGASMHPETIVQVGEQIKVYVIEPENQDGNPILSKKRADFEAAWERVQQARNSGETLHAMVTDRVKGGLVVDLGIRGFVPASHVGNGSLKNNLDRFVGQSIALKVIEVDKDRRKVVLSNKLALAEEREQRSAETRASLAPGQVRRGIVRRLTNYGAFIDLGGIDGLLHISEMSWTRINDPKEVLREGQEIDVQILKMDLENNRVSLGLRQILPDPWGVISERYHEGDVITGTITRIVPFGAFVQVEGGVEGIIPNSEMPRGRGKAQAVAANDAVTVKVIGLRPDERKMTLSLRALQQPEERDAPAPREAPTTAPAAPGGGGGGGRRGRGGERERDEDYGRYAPGGRHDEPPRFTIGDAFAAQRRERSKRDRREQQEQEADDFDDLDLETETVEAVALDEGDANSSDAGSLPGGIEAIPQADLEAEAAGEHGGQENRTA